MIIFKNPNIKSALTRTNLTPNFALMEPYMTDFDQELDASGLNCPLPILRAKKTLQKMGSGQVLRIVATDPGSVKDFDAFAKQTGNSLLHSGEEGEKFVFLMQKT